MVARASADGYTIGFDNMSFSLPHVKGSRVRALGVTSAKRCAALPELSAIAEGGVAGFEGISCNTMALQAA